MSGDLLQTKLYVPRLRPFLVPRHHLIEKLNQGLQQGCKLTLVSAPAGFGKTTLIADWGLRISESETIPKLCWLSLDEGDNDLNSFLIYFIAAMQTVEPDFGLEPLAALQSSGATNIEAVLMVLLNEIADLSQTLVLVLDDYHVIENQLIDKALTFLLDHLPATLHLVITTRIDPALPLARLRGRGQLTELRVADLRFTNEEATKFLNQMMHLEISAENIAALGARTEGWITGLQLAALSLQERDPERVTRFIQSFTGTHHHILDYLVEEVLDQQTEEIQAFLLQTSILDQLTDSLCDAVTGQENGQETLEMLERANLFTIPLDNERQWYRYHHLFADLLVQRLRQTQGEKIPVLHIKAGDWFNQQGMQREAIKHSLAAMDYEKAGKLIESIAIDVMEQGEHSTVVRWIKSLPDEVTKERPYLCVLQAWALLLSGQMEAAESRLLDAENALEIQSHTADQRDFKIIMGLIYSNRAYLTFLQGQHAQTIDYARKALIGLPENAALFRAQTGIYLGVAYRYRGQLQEAYDTYHETLPIAKHLRGKIAVQCSQNMGDLLWQMGKLNQAQDILEEALQITEQHVGHSDMPYCGFVYMLIGRILYQRGELAEAQQIIEKGFSLCRDWNLPEITALSCLELANIYWALGNHDQARESFQEAIQIFGGFSLWGRKSAEAYQAKFEIALGNTVAAEQWAQSNDLTTDGDYEFHREIEYFVLTRLLIVQKKFEEAYALAARICHIGKETSNKRAELESLILLSLIIYGQGNAEQAFEYLLKAIAIAEPQGIIRIFVDEGPQMARLLYAALEKGIASDYVRKLLAAFPAAEPEKAAKKQPSESDSDWIEPLSDRELEVLHLMAQDLSYQEIADQIMVSLNTVRTHVKNIYSKLMVHKRSQAVAKARELNLL